MHANNILLQKVITLAQEAGDAVMELYRNQKYTIFTKKDHTPVTDADFLAHEIILAGLASTKIPVISEESYELNHGVDLTQEFWLTDPIDGTQEFIAGSDEFTINIALVHNHVAVLGVVYAPALQEMFFAQKNSGAWNQIDKNTTQALQTRDFTSKKFTYLVSRRRKQESLARFRSQFPGADILPCGSSLKFCRIAQGFADLYVRRGAIWEWDTAAAQCILEEAGGCVVSFTGQALTYGHVDLLHQGLVASGNEKAMSMDIFSR